MTKGNQQGADMKTKSEIIEYLKNAGVFVYGRVKMKVVDHKGNPLAPERFCYKVFFTDSEGNRTRLAVWPETVGYQGF